MKIFSFPSVKTYGLGTQKNRLIETVLLSTHIICWLLLFFNYAFLSGCLIAAQLTSVSSPVSDEQSCPPLKTGFTIHVVVLERM